MVQGDNEYHAAIEPSGGGYIVTFAYGRRGSTLSTGVKTAAPVSLPEAGKVFDRLFASKTAKGYRPHGANAPVYQRNGEEGADTGIRPQLLNPVEESELQRLLGDGRRCIQEELDGRRLMVGKSGDAINGINRRSLIAAIPGPVRAAVEAIGLNLLIDGEAVGDTPWTSPRICTAGTTRSWSSRSIRTTKHQRLPPGGHHGSHRGRHRRSHARQHPCLRLHPRIQNRPLAAE